MSSTGVLPIDLPARVPQPPSRLSPSAADTFRQCPRRWRFRYVERRTEPAGEAAVVGRFAHRALELLLAEPRAERTIDKARELAREAWPETEDTDDFRGLGLDDDGARAFRWKGWKAIEGLWTVEDPTKVEVDATEQALQAEVGGVPFLGIVDRVDRTDAGLVITDYKSGKPPSSRYLKDKLSQVYLYAAAVEVVRGERPARVRLLYLGQRRVDVAARPDKVHEAVEQLSTTWDNLVTACESDEFEPRTGPLCGWCPHVADCPEGQAEVSVRLESGRMRSDAPAVALMA
ncbi:MAG: PD-(D/E)XK nuclease family protein [Actinomycetia bacterium]|nr:PD-(D/E)XK nuclease family protein [Actinomycetes bacterium]MCP3911209.1 PD-(D/E)XK nuclease family protein [Actinomycetes bacterium]MCP4083455.1 PD-(D/E)XK nuclease family protein [Actinomycetes bacterium]